MMPLSLDEAIGHVPQWKNAEVKTEFLAGGITNANYRVDVEGQSFVLRIAGENTELLGISREQEHLANLAAAQIGIAPEVIYFFEPHGYLVTRFIPGKPLSPEQMRETATIQRVASALKRIHALPALKAAFSPFRTVKTYEQIARRHGVAFPDDFDRYLQHQQAIEAAFLKKPFVPHLCHNDLLNENFLDDGNIRILDWEYAGMGDVFFDLANFAVHHSFTSQEDRLLLEMYFGTATTSGIARLNLMKIMSDFREAMWGMVQQGISKLDFDFRSYANQHFERMTARIANPQRDQWLDEVTHDA
jgi:thiamine kinase-like enzyme